MKILPAILVLAVLGSAQAYADCSYPMAPTKVPDGSTATMQQMVAAMTQLKSYNEQIKAYTDCLKLEHDTALAKADPQMTKEQKDEIEKVYVQKNDAAVDAATNVTNRFNEQVRIFKAKQNKS
jgi:exo-beta-1,3-glucanase (GH17 family)